MPIIYDEDIPKEKPTKSTQKSQFNIVYDDEVTNNKVDQAQPTMLGAIGKSAAESVLPTAGGLAGAGMAISAGAPLIAGATAAAGPVGTIGATVGLGLAGGIGGSKALEAVQSEALKLVPKDWLKMVGFDPETRQAETKAYPKSSFVGGMLPSLAAFRPGSVPKSERAAGAVLGGAVEAGGQAVGNEPMDWGKVGMATAFQAGAPKPTALGRKVLGISADSPAATPKPTPSPTGGKAPTGSTEAPKPPTPGEMETKKNEDSLIREFELGTDPKKQLDQAAFMDTKTGEIIDQGAGHDDVLKQNPDLVAGFRLKDGTFVTRKEAAVIAQDQHSDKLVKKIDPKEGLHSTDFGSERMDALKPKAKTAAQELGMRTDTRKNFYEDLDNAEHRLAMLEQEMENKVDSMSTKEQFDANKEIKDLEKKIGEARKEAPAFESKGEKQSRIEYIPTEQRTLKEQQELDALKQLGEHDPRHMDWEDTHDLLRGSKTATEALQRIVDGGHAQQPYIELSKLLIKNQLLGNAKINFFDFEVPFKGGKPGDITPGEYDPAKHSINMYSGGDIQIYLHETIHAAVHAMQVQGTHASAKAIKKLYEDFKSTVSDKAKQGEYGLTNELEFLAEAFTNPKFQRFLSTRYMLDTPSKTMWQGFKDIVKDSLGIKKQNQAASALDQVLDHGAVLLEEGFVTSERTPTTGGKPLPSKGTATPAASAVDPDRYNPRKVTDEADLKLKGKELYASKGEAAAREFLQGYEKYKQDWVDPVKFVEDSVELNINNQMAIRRNVTNNAERLKEMVPNPATREQVAVAIDAKKADTLTGPAKDLADKYTGWMKDIGERALKEGVVKGLLEDYVTHIVNWADMPKGALETFLKDVFKREGDPTKKMTPESRFGLERKIDNFTQLERVLAEINDRIAMAGKDFKLEIKTKDIAEIYKQYGLSMEKAIENKKLVESVLTARNPAGESMVRRVTEETPLPRGWEMIKDRQFAGYAVHPDLAPALKFAFESKGGAVLNGLYAVSQGVKRLNVIASFFHAKSLLEVLSSTGVPIYTPLKEVGLGIVDKALGTQFSGIRKAVEQFKKGGLGDSVDKWIKDGLVLEIPEDVKRGILASTGKFADSMIGKFGPKTRILESALSTTEKYTLGVTDKITWEYLHTGGKLYVADKYLEKARIDAGKQGKPFDESAARKEITSFVNKSFGGLNWFQEARAVQNEFGKRMAMAAFSPEGRKSLQIMLFAPDWTISTIKAFTAALPKELNPTKWHPIEGVKGMATPSTKADYARLYQFKTAITYVTLLNAINMMTANRPIWQNQDPTRIEWPDGTSMQAMKHAMEPYHWISDPDKTLTNKLGFIPKAAMIAGTGLEYASPYAPKMVDPSAVNRAKAIGAMAMPFQATAGLSAPEGEGGKRALLGTLGLPVYGSTTDQKKAKNKERAKQVKEKRKQYKEREREKGRE